jgi:signal transduction histidine kinase
MSIDVSKRPADEISSGAPDELAQVSIRLRVILFAILGASALVASVACVASGEAVALGTAMAGAVFSSIALWLDRRGRVATAVRLLLVSMLVAVTGAMIAGEGIHDAGMILYPMIVVTGSMLLRPRAYVALVAAVVASVAAVFWLGWTGRIAARFRDLTDPTDLVAIVTVLVIQAIAVEVLALGLFRSVREARREAADRRLAEAEVRRLNEELERRVEARTAELAEANEELEAFSYSVSHDLRAPLRVVGGYVGILDQDYATGWEPQARHLLERIRTWNSHMNVLIEQLLAFSRLGRRDLVREPVDMEAMVRRVIDALTEAEPDRQVEWVVGRLPPAWADPVLMEQVLQNVVGNAFKYTGKQSRARIEVGFSDGRSDAGYFVRDNGVGFDMSQANRLFGVFERLHRDDAFEGTGIGLATVHRILKKHGGTVEAFSEPGNGATFRFRVPPRPVAAAA